MLDLLLVEDDPFLQSIEMRLIQHCHHNVFLAESGERALEMLQSYRFDGVLMDLNMPGMSGLEAMAALKSFAISQPVIALTGNNDAETRQLCLNSGMLDCIHKPLTPEKIQSFVTTFCRYLDSSKLAVP